MRKYLISKIRSTFAKWVISYLAVLLIPMLFGVIIYGHALNNMRQESSYVQQQTLKQVRQNFENQLNLLYNMAYGILNSGTVEAVWEPARGGTYSPEQNLAMYDIQKQLINAETINETIEAIYLYYPKTDYILSGNVFCPLENTKSFETERYGEPVSELRERTGEKTFYGKLDMTGEGQERLVYSYVTESVPGDEASRILLLIYLKQAPIRELFDISGATTLLVWEDGSCYTASGGGNEEILTIEESGDALSETNLILRMGSEHDSFEYVSVMPRSIYMKKVDQMKWIMAAYLILCLGGGSLAAWLAARKNYLPVRELLQIVIGREKREGNDFLLIKESYQNLKKAFSESEIIRRKTIRAERSLLLSEMIAGRRRIECAEETKEWLEQVDFDRYLMAGVEAVCPGTVQEGETPRSDELDTAYFIIGNVLHELLETRYPSVEAEAEGMLLSVVSVPEGGQEQEKRIYGDLFKRLSELLRFLKDTYDMKLTIQVSGFHSGTEQLPDCFQDIQMELEYRNTVRKEIPEILFPEDIRYTNTELRYQESCRMIGRLLAEKKMGEALRQLSELVPETSESKERRDWEEGTEGVSATDRMVDSVKSHIDANYCDSMLTVSRIAEEFHVGISYLSREFKRRNGSGILEYINQLRLGKAKEFLLLGHTIKESAEKVGFYDTQPLIRLFRQVEGMTPSEYRNLRLKNKQEG